MADDDCVILAENRSPACRVQHSTPQSTGKRLKQARLQFRVKESPTAVAKSATTDAATDKDLNINADDCSIVCSPKKSSAMKSPVVKKRRIELVTLAPACNLNTNDVLHTEQISASGESCVTAENKENINSCSAVSLLSTSTDTDAAETQKHANSEKISNPEVSASVNERKDALKEEEQTISKDGELIKEQGISKEEVSRVGVVECEEEQIKKEDELNEEKLSKECEVSVEEEGKEEGLSEEEGERKEKKSGGDESLCNTLVLSSDDSADLEHDKSTKSSQSTTFDKASCKVGPVVTKKQKIQLKEQRERQRAEAKDRRERERNEYKMKKEQEKQEKENEREEKKRQKIEEKQKKMEQIELEKKKKLEQIELDKKKKEELKLEEKKKKEEEKKRKEEEKQQEIEKVSQKEKQLMQNFFFKSVKEKIPSKSQQTGEKRTIFMEFEVKPDMRMAPRCRISSKEKLEEISQNLFKLIENQTCTSLYLDELRSKSLKPQTSAKTWPCHEVSVVNVESGSVCTETQNNKSLMKAKLFQFHENHRPAYYGTWRKKSALIGGRTPLCKDTDVLDYEVDSDDEWEEEEPGESISHSEGENDDEQAGDDDDDDDGFFVPHGYLSEDEVCEDEEEVSPATLKEYQQAKARRWEAEMSSKRCEVLKPVCVTVRWWDSAPINPAHERMLNEFKMVFLESVPIQLTRGNETSTEQVSVESERGKTLDGSSKKSKGKSMPVPVEALPDLIRLIRGNQHSIQKLIKEFQEYLCKHSAPAETPSDGVTVDARAGDTEKYTVSKRQIETKIREMASYEMRSHLYNKKLWYVKDEVLHRLGLLGLPVPTQWKWSTSSFDDKVTKI